MWGCGLMHRLISRLSRKNPVFYSKLEIEVASQFAGQKVIEAELMWVDCSASSGHFMNHKR